MYCSKIEAQKRDYEKQITQLLYKEVIASPPRLDTNLTRVSITECHLPLCSDCSVEDYKTPSVIVQYKLFCQAVS